MCSNTKGLEEMLNNWRDKISKEKPLGIKPSLKTLLILRLVSFSALGLGPGYLTQESFIQGGTTW